MMSVPPLRDAKALQVGAVPAVAAYVGDELVWSAGPPPPPPEPPEFVDANATGRSAATGQIALGAGSGVADDVTLVAILLRKHMSLSVPSGWTELSGSPWDDEQSATSMRVRVFWRTLTGGESSSDFIFVTSTGDTPDSRASGARATYRNTPGPARHAANTTGQTNTVSTGELTDAPANVRWVSFLAGGLGVDVNVGTPSPSTSRAHARDGTGTSPVLPVRVSDDAPTENSSGVRSAPASTDDGASDANGTVGVLIELELGGG